MAEVVPFKAFRPSADKVHLVPSRPFGSYSKKEMVEKLTTNPYTFLHVLRPDFGEKEHGDPHSEEYLNKIKNKFDEFVEKGFIEQDEQHCFYIYRQIKDNHTQTGIIGCISIDDYFNGVIKKHEETLSVREEKLKEYLKVVDINAEPVCFAFEDHDVVSKAMADAVKERPLCDFSTTNEIRHQLWSIDDPEVLFRIQGAFAEIDRIYIADGHHRSASSGLLGLEKRIVRGRPHGALSDYFMGIFIPESELRILDFNRVVTDLNGLTEEEFLEKVNEEFAITPIGNELKAPQKIHQFSMYLHGKAYYLEAHNDSYDHDNPVSYLDPTILNKHILNPILGIKDIRNDKRIDFVGGHEGMKKLQRKVDSGKMEVAFGLFPVTMEHLKKIADNEQVMPPKSTWIEPKLRSGMTIYSLSI